MEPLFLAVICGCNAGLFREALREVYIPRIQRGDALFAAKVLGATGPLLSALVHFFADGRWGSLVETAAEGQSLTAEDQLFILMQAGLYLSTTRGMGAPEPRICYERAEPLCHSLNYPRLLYMALNGQFRYTLMADKLSATIRIAQRLFSLAREQNDAGLILAACGALVVTLYHSGEFETAREYATVERFGSVAQGRLPSESPSISSPRQLLLRLPALPLRPLSKTRGAWIWESQRLDSWGDGFIEDRAELGDCLCSCSPSFGGRRDEQP
jgi:hypothetical protein